MLDLSAGASAKVTLKPGQVCRVGTGGTATVIAKPSNDSALRRTFSAGTQDFGPFGVLTALRITATAGSVGYSILPESFRANQRIADDVPYPEFVVLRQRIRHTLLVENGPLPQFYRSALSGGRSYVRDHLGHAWQAQHGECVFYGARRVEQLLSSASNFTAAYWSKISLLTVDPVYDSNIPGPRGRQNAFLVTKPATAGACLRMATGIAYRAVRHVRSLWIRAGSATTAEIQLGVLGGAALGAKTVNLTTSWKRFAVAGTPDGTTVYGVSVSPGTIAGAVAGTIYIADDMLEEKLDGSDAPSEFVDGSASPESRYWHGAGVDKVQYFDTALGNTVDANGLVTEAAGAAITGTMGVMTFPASTNHVLNNDVASGWTAGTGATLTDNAAVAPDGSMTAIAIDEGSSGAGSITHYVSRALTGTGAIAVAYVNSNGETWGSFPVFLKRGTGAAGADWMRLVATDTNGTTISAYVDVATGVVQDGQVSNGTLNIEPWGENWWRCLWTMRARPNAGSTDVGIRIAMAGGPGTPTYVASGRVNYFWLPCFHLGVSASNGQRPVAMPAQKTAAAASTQAGQALSASVKGVIGRTDFAVASIYRPYYRIEQTDKQTYTAVASILTDAPLESRGTAASGVGQLNMDRTGATIRPPFSGGSGNAKFAMDFYNGDPNPIWFHQSGRYYSVGDYVIPRDTQPNNDNSKKVFTCVVPGLSGPTEPTWVSTFTSPPDATSNLTADTSGSPVRWQCNVDNGIGGSYEPYSGAELLGLRGFMGEYRVVWFLTRDDYGMFINGEEAHKQTTPRPMFPAKGFTLDYDPKTLYLGTIGTSGGQYPEAVPSGQEQGVMPSHTAIHSDLIVWSPAPPAAALQDYSRLTAPR